MMRLWKTPGRTVAVLSSSLCAFSMVAVPVTRADAAAMSGYPVTSVKQPAQPMQFAQPVQYGGPLVAGATGKLDIRSIVPAPGSTLDEVPAEIVVTFGAKPAVAIIEAKVGGKALRIPPPVISGNKATGKIPAGSPKGEYTVVIAGTTQDRKVAKQQFTFTVSSGKPADKPKPTQTAQPTATKPGQPTPGQTKPAETKPAGTAGPTSPAAGGRQPGQTTNPASTAIPGGSDGQPGGGNPALDAAAGDNIPQRPTVPTAVKVLMGVLAVAFFGLLYLSWRNQQQPRRRGPQYDHTPLDQQGKQAP